MRYIDFHAHAFPDSLAERAMKQLCAECPDVRAFLDGKLSSLLASMDRNSIEKSVLCCIATRPAQFEPIFDWCRQIASERIVPFPSVHPADAQCVEKVYQIAEAGFKGIKMHPYYQGFDLDDWANDALYEAICRTGLLLTVHSGFDIAFERVERSSPQQALNVLERFAGLRLVLTHFGGWQQWDQVERLLLGRPIYMEISWSLDCLEPDQARRLLLGHPEDYLLFGTDSPWADQAAAIRTIESFGLPDSLLERLFRRNAQTLLG